VRSAGLGLGTAVAEVDTTPSLSMSDSAATVVILSQSRAVIHNCRNIGAASNGTFSKFAQLLCNQK